MWKNKLLIGLGVLIILVDVLGFADFMKEYITVASAIVIVLLAVWQYSESKEQ